MSADENRLIVVGAIKGAHGVRGEVRVKSFTALPEDVFGYGALMDEAGKPVLTPVNTKPGKDHFIVRPKEQKQKEEWDALKGTLLHVPRSRLPDTEDDEFYIEDLIGLSVFAGGNEPAGMVRAVQNFGADDLLEIRLKDRGATILVPFTLVDVPTVDLASGRVVIPDLTTWAEQDEGD
ncbi:MAG: 16S rRNA processing protein RimM [Hyphomonas sp.]|nr:16S rRNA processing protein RimM [Hyphomonas sp.]